MTDAPRFRQVAGPTVDEVERLKADLIRAARAEQSAYSRIEDAERQATRWRGRARLALEHGDEDLARQALERSARYAEHAAEARTQLTEIADHVAYLKQQLRELQWRGPIGGSRLVVDVDPLVERFERLEREAAQAHLDREVERMKAELAARQAGAPSDGAEGAGAGAAASATGQVGGTAPDVPAASGS